MKHSCARSVIPCPGRVNLGDVMSAENDPLGKRSWQAGDDIGADARLGMGFDA